MVPLKVEYLHNAVTVWRTIWKQSTCTLQLLLGAPFESRLAHLPGAELGGPLPPQILPGPPKFFRSLSESPTQTIDSSPCCKTSPSSGPPKWKCLAPPLPLTHCSCSRGPLWRQSTELWCGSENTIWANNTFFTKKEEYLHTKYLPSCITGKF